MRALFVLALLFAAPAFAGRSVVRVKPHITKKGRLVTPHVRTSPDSSRANNFGALKVKKGKK
jgi:hypothetical protein